MISCPIYVGCLAPLYRMFYAANLAATTNLQGECLKPI